MSETNSEKTRPAHILLGALTRTLESVNDVKQLPEIIAALKFADAAEGTSQAPIWKTVATMLDNLTTAHMAADLSADGQSASKR